jgi:hypothetical protein
MLSQIKNGLMLKLRLILLMEPRPPNKLLLMLLKPSLMVSMPHKPWMMPPLLVPDSMMLKENLNRQEKDLSTPKTTSMQLKKISGPLKKNSMMQNGKWEMSTATLSGNKLMQD